MSLWCWERVTKHNSYLLSTRSYHVSLSDPELLAYDATQTVYIGFNWLTSGSSWRIWRTKSVLRTSTRHTITTRVSLRQLPNWFSLTRIFCDLNHRIRSTSQPDFNMSQSYSIRDPNARYHCISDTGDLRWNIAFIMSEIKYRLNMQCSKKVS